MSQKTPSQLEERFLFQLRALGLPEPVREHVFHPARKWRFDFAYVSERVAFEIEGGIWSGGRHNMRVDKDIEKYTAAALLDWFVYRVTPEAIRDGRGARWAKRFLTGWRTSGHDDTVPLPVRFWTKVERGDRSVCWPWTGRRDSNGYGEFQMNGNKERAPRVALWLSGVVESGAQVAMHSCDNPPCCNPAHLSFGSPHDNTTDAKIKGRLRYYVKHAQRDALGRVVAREQS